MSHRLQVTLDDELFAALQAEADRTGASLAEVVRRSVAGRLGALSAEDRRETLRRTAGIWADRRESGVETQRRLRAGLLERADTLEKRERRRARDAS